MFDGKIDFMDFNKIKINYGGKLTRRKIFKRKFLIFVILSNICIIIFAVLFSLKNKKIEGIMIETKEFLEQISEIENNLNLTKKQNMEDEKNLNEFQNQIDKIKNEIKEITEKEESIKAKNNDIISERDKYERQSTTLSMQLKTETELKEIYQQKISSLSTLLNSLKIEYDKLKEQTGNIQDEDNLSIDNSKIINSIEALTIERQIKGKIKDKCFDGEEDNFDPVLFHKKCDKSAVLVLIKTNKKERIGAFTRVSFEGTEVKRDPSSVLFNINNGKFYHLANSEHSVIICDPNLLPLFGVDLQIKSNGQGINSFPFNYGDKNIDTHEDLTKNTVFTIENLEIYKVEF
jgi:hypothetical protein